MARDCISSISYYNRSANEERSRALSDQCDDKIPPFSEASSVHGVWQFKVITIRTLYLHLYHISCFIQAFSDHYRFQFTCLAPVICAHPWLLFHSVSLHLMTTFIIFRVWLEGEDFQPATRPDGNTSNHNITSRVFILWFASLSSTSVSCSLWWDSCHWNSSFRIGPLVSMAMSGSCLDRWAFTEVILVICACLHYAPMSKMLLEAVHHTQLLCVTDSAWPLLRQCLVRVSWARHGHTHGERVVRSHNAPVVTFQMARACISSMSYSNRLANEERSRALSD